MVAASKCNENVSKNTNLYLRSATVKEYHFDLGLGHTILEFPRRHNIPSCRVNGSKESFPVFPLAMTTVEEKRFPSSKVGVEEHLCKHF